MLRAEKPVYIIYPILTVRYSPNTIDDLTTRNEQVKQDLTPELVDLFAEYARFHPLAQKAVGQR